ncbi:acyl-CoA thioesterase [Novosphingobium bradum]|uniref:Acyl-CoA thioesterase n=1 Tax=Novosphingobium bradum TaxID=1737444 RepID=A0ABV7IP74_9SPHN
MSQAPHPKALALLSHLAVQGEGGDVWTAAATPEALRTGRARIYGGQVVAQALLAAEASTVGAGVSDGRPAASFHCRFLRPGAVDQPIAFRVARDLDGRSFTHRRVVAEQGGKPILTASVMFHAPEPGVAHQPEMPATISPEEALATVAAERAGTGPLARIASLIVSDSRAFDMIPVDLAQWDLAEPRPAPVHVWLRFGAPIGDDPARHRAALAYMSDVSLMQASDVRHGLNWWRGEVNTASLDHMVWFHEPDVRADQWLLYTTMSDRAAHGRLLARGEIYDRAGRLVATTTQEALSRLSEDAAARVLG